MAEETKEKDEKDSYAFFDSIKSSMIDYINSIDAGFKKINNANRLETGFPGLDFDNGNLIVLASRPGIGKTAFAMSLIKKLAVDKSIPVGFIDTGSMENTALAAKLLSITSGLSNGKIKKALLTLSDFKKIRAAAEQIYSAPVYTAIKPNCSFDDFVLSAESMLEEVAVKLIIVEGFDFFREIIDSEKKFYRFDLENLMDSFKQFAVKHNIPIVLVMRLPPAETENENEPGIMDFKKKFIVPYKADMVLVLHREGEKEESEYAYSKLIVAKNVHHITFDIPLKYHPVTCSFEEI